MTKEEAIKRIQDHMRVHKIEAYPHVRLKEALDMAISALRAQQTPLDQSRWEGCEYCTDVIFMDGEIYASLKDSAFRAKPDYYHFCPMCGRPLTEKAWAKLERRIGGNDEKTDNA